MCGLITWIIRTRKAAAQEQKDKLKREALQNSSTEGISQKARAQQEADHRFSR